VKYGLKNLLSYILKKAKSLGRLLKKAAITVTLFLYRSRRTVLLVAAVFLVTLIFSFSVATWLSSNSYAPNTDYDRTVPTVGTIVFQDLEIFGGDVTVESDAVLIDWGELTIGASKNTTFFVKSTSNIDVALELNVTNWMPAGIEEYITISWNYNGTVLNPNHRPLLVTVNLEVASSGDFIDFLITNEVTAFGFDITIYASGV
jgi:hypothetical protein